MYSSTVHKTVLFCKLHDAFVFILSRARYWFDWAKTLIHSFHLVLFRIKVSFVGLFFNWLSGITPVIWFTSHVLQPAGDRKAIHCVKTPPPIIPKCLTFGAPSLT